MHAPIAGDPLLWPCPSAYPAGPVVYLIHLERPFKHARHYVGSTQNLLERIRCYRAANADACAFMRAVHRAAIDWDVAAVWSFETIEEALTWEYSFKKSGRGKHSRTAARSCPACRESALKLNRERMRRLRARRREDER